MKKLNGRELKALLVLSIVVPISLLSTFRLTGILQGPITISETITLDAIKWEFERSNRFVYIDKRLEGFYALDEISATMLLVVGTYTDNASAYLGADVVTLGIEINSTITSPNSFIESVYVSFTRDFQQSTVGWVHSYLNFTNLSLMDLKEGIINGKDYTKAYIRLAGANHPSNVLLKAVAEWYLLTSNDQTHQMETTYEFIYYNGTAYEKVIQSFQLKIVGR